MNLSFGNPALLWGALLFAVPLIIHLLNRRRYRVIRWAAQQFLLQAYQRTRRRLTLESLLLLLLRCALIVLLALALARPFVPSSSVLSMFTPSRRSVVLVMDTSYSMGRMTRTGETLMDRARQQATRILEGLAEDRGDEVTVVALADPPRTLHSTTSRIDRVKDAVERLQPDWRGADLVRTLDYLTENVLGSGHKDIYLLTDLQRETFQPGGARLDQDAEERERAATPASAWRVAAEHDARFVIVDVGAAEPAVNVTVEELASRPENVVAGEVVRFTATVRNHTTHELRGVGGRFVFDGRQEQAKPVTFDLPPGGVVAVETSTILRDEGATRASHTVRFEIDEDDLPADDRRFLAFTVNESIRVLLVDGEALGEPGGGETEVLADMLNPSADPETGGSVFRLKIIDDRRFGRPGGENLADYDLIVLANVPRIDPQVARELDDAVRAGRGLLIFMGDLVDVRSYNERLYAVDGTGLLPARLVEPRGDTRQDSDVHFLPRVDDFHHPVLRVFADPLLQPMLQGVPVRRFMETERSAKDRSTQVILALDDDPADPSPLILEKPAGRGRVVLVTTTADDDWAGFAAHNNVIAYLPLVQELASYLTMSDVALFNLTVGDPLRRTTRSIPSEVHVTRPDNVREAITDTPREMEYGEFVLPPFLATREPGFYALELAYPLAGAGNDAGRQEVEHFAFNVDVRESDLARVAREAFPTLYPGLEVEFIDEVEAAPLADPSAREGDLWRPVLWTLVALLAGELVLSWWFGRGTRGGLA